MILKTTLSNNYFQTKDNKPHIICEIFVLPVSVKNDLNNTQKSTNGINNLLIIK